MLKKCRCLYFPRHQIRAVPIQWMAQKEALKFLPIPMPRDSSNSIIDASGIFRGNASPSIPSSRRGKDEIHEPLRSLKPYILNNWISLLESWPDEQSFFADLLDRSNFGGILDSVFRITDFLSEDEDPCASLPTNGGNLSMGKTVDCRMHEPVCVALYQTCLEAFRSGIRAFHPLSVNGQNLEENELEDLVELATRAAIQLEMDSHGRPCQGPECPFARDYPISLGGSKGRAIL